MIDGAQDYIERDSLGRVIYSATLQAKLAALQQNIDDIDIIGSVGPQGPTGPQGPPGPPGAGTDPDYFIVENEVQARTYDIPNGWTAINGADGGLETITADTLGYIDSERRFNPTPDQLWIVGATIALYPVDSDAKIVLNLFFDTAQDTLIARGANNFPTTQLVAMTGSQMIVTKPTVTGSFYQLYIFNGGTTSQLESATPKYLYFWGLRLDDDINS